MALSSCRGIALLIGRGWRQFRKPAFAKAIISFVCTAERAERMLAARYIRTRRLPIDIDHMIAWCRRNNYKIDEAGRAIYGSAMAGALLVVLIEDKIARSIQ